MTLPESARLPDHAVGRVRRAGPPGARHRLRHGPAAAGRMLNLNETQAGVLQPGVQDRRRQRPAAARPERPARHAAVRGRQRQPSSPPSTATSAPPASAPSSAACCRSRARAATQFFGEPMLNIADFMQTDGDGRGVVNILAADKLMNSPRLYATFLLWMLSELFEQLPEVGDLDKPKLVFFFDEAHLLFNDAPKALVERIELVVRLVRSKGVGVYFVTQNPLDIPDSVLAQLGNRVQHALRAFTPRDQKAVKAAAETMRAKPGPRHRDRHHRTGRGRGAGEPAGRQGPPRRHRARLSCCRRAARSARSRQRSARRCSPSSLVAGVYEKAVDRESAYEKLKGRAEASATPPRARPAKARTAKQKPQGGGAARRPERRAVRHHRPTRRQARRPGPVHGQVRRAHHGLDCGPRDHPRRAGRPFRRQEAVTLEGTHHEPGSPHHPPAGAAQAHADAQEGRQHQQLSHPAQRTEHADGLRGHCATCRCTTWRSKPRWRP